MLFMLFIESLCTSVAQVELGTCCRQASSEVCDGGPESSSERSGSPMSASGGRAMSVALCSGVLRLPVLSRRPLC